ncbi:hypothetical protein [Marmoricola sp. URHA0025 HA25]
MASAVVGAPAFGAQSDNGDSHSAQGQAHKGQGNTQGKAQGTGRKSLHQHSAHGGAGAAAARGGGSDVSLPRPNDFQAQADPDGMANGGVDQPGGTGGVDTTAQDGNNGSGNDVDCEDDNNGVGVPGHCRPKADDSPTGTDSVDQDQQAFAPVVVPDTLVSPPHTGDTVVRGVFGTSAPLTSAAAGILPDTGAGQALLGLAIAAFVALGLGTALVHQGRRTSRSSG